MEHVAIGICDNGYYAGWDGIGTSTLDTCKAVCLADSRCTFIAYYPEKTCSRYQGETCGIMSGAENYDMHTVYKKERQEQGKFLLFGH